MLSQGTFPLRDLETAESGVLIAGRQARRHVRGNILGVETPEFAGFCDSDLAGADLRLPAGVAGDTP